MKPSLVIILFLAFISSGCIVFQIDSRDSTKEYYSPKTSIDEVAYLEKVDKAFTEIGIVNVTTERRRPMEEVLPKLKQEAGMLGADAITDVQCNPTDFWKRVGSQKILSNAYIRTTCTASAIVWK